MTTPKEKSVSPMMPLFVKEAEAQAKALEEGIAAAREGREGAFQLVARSVQSLRSASRLVGLKTIGALCQDVDDFVARISQGQASSDESSVGLLGSFAELIRSIGSRPELVTTQVEACADVINNLSAELRKQASAKVETSPVATAPAGSVAVPATRSPVPVQPSPAPTPAPSPVRSIEVDPVMLELFRTELLNHTRVLELGLVRLEGDQTPRSVEPLMRAAHSIKGAARIVGLDLPVGLAHRMEDLLSAAFKGARILSADDIDLLLRGNDLFARLAKVQPAATASFLESQSDAIGDIRSALQSTFEHPQQPGDRPLAPGPAKPAEPAPPESQVAISPAAPARQARADAGAPRPIVQDTPEPELVRVLADNLNRLMGLAGESLVQAKSTRRFSQSLMRFKGVQLRQASVLQGLLDWTEQDGLPDAVRLKVSECLQMSEQSVEGLRKEIEELGLFSARLEHLANRIYGEVVSTRMRPFSEGTHGFPRMVRDLARQLGRQINFEVQGGATPVDRDILEKLEAPLTHLLRNAIDHGLEPPEVREAAGKPRTGRLVLEARHASGMLHITVQDDGKGIDKEKIRTLVVERGQVAPEMAARLSKNELLDFLFLPGFSTAKTVTETSGRGVGLDVVLSMVKEVGGSIAVDSEPGQGATFNLSLPLTLSVLRTLVLKIAGEYYAIPHSRIDRVLRLKGDDFQTIEDRQFCTVRGETIGVVDATQVLQLPRGRTSRSHLSVLVISDRLSRYGLLVDQFCGQQELVVLPLDPRLGKVPNISAGAILEDGSPVLILDAEDLVRSIDNLLTYGKPASIRDAQATSESRRKRVLVVDDSLTVREVERRLLQNRGYEVVVGVDGMDGWNLLQGEKFDLVITDVDMPRLDGIELVTRIKKSPLLKDMPVMIVSYKDRDEDRLRGLQAGANYYLTKSSFHDESLGNAVRDLIGTAEGEMKK